MEAQPEPSQTQSTIITEKLPDAGKRKTALTVCKRISDTPPAVNEFQKQQENLANSPTPSGGEAYPASIEKMSERWREIQQQERETDQQQSQPPGSFVEKNYLAIGIGISLLILALVVVFGGLAFLIWRAR